MAASFSELRREFLSHHGHGQGGKKQELIAVKAGTANTATSLALNTRLNKIEFVFVGKNGPDGDARLDEADNVDADGAINAGGTSVSVAWSTSPKADTVYSFSFYGH